MRWTSVTAAILALTGSAMAYVGQLDSPAGSLDTVRPTVSSVTVQTGQMIEVAFSEAMLEPGVTTPANYAISGDGAGTLAATPTTVSGAGPYTLNWDSGEMLIGTPVTVTVTDVQDAVGNVITTPNSGDGMRLEVPLVWWPIVLVLALAAGASVRS